MLYPNLPPEELDNIKHYPILIKYIYGGEDILTCPQDSRGIEGFYITETNFKIEGRFIIGSSVTKQ